MKVASAATEDVGQVVMLASDLGDAPADGSTSPVVIGARLPSGLEALAITGATANPGLRLAHAPVVCAVSSLSCSYGGTLPAYEAIEVIVWARVDSGAYAGEEVTASVEGGGAPSAVEGSLTTLFGEPLFGAQSYEVSPEAEGGGSVGQAGGHPFQLTTTLTLNQTGERTAVALAKDLEFTLPPGLVAPHRLSDLHAAAVLEHRRRRDGLSRRHGAGRGDRQLHVPGRLGWRHQKEPAEPVGAGVQPFTRNAASRRGLGS